MAWIEKRKGGYCVCERQPWGEPARYRSRTFRTRRAAQEHAREVSDTVRQGRRYEPVRVEEIPTIGEVVVLYLKDVSRFRAPSTVATYTSQLAAFVEWLAKTSTAQRVTLDQLSRSVLETYWSSIVEGGGAVNSANLAIGLIQRFWAWAANHDDLCDMTPPPRTITLINEPAPLTVAPTWAQMDACVEASEDVVHRRLLMVLRFTGLRVGQALQLTWDDLDLDEAVLRIRPELGKSRQEKRGRVIPVSKHLVKRAAGWGRREGLLVGDGLKRQRCRYLSHRCWQATDFRSEGRQQPHHWFRKGWRTGLQIAGANERALEYLLGHDQGIIGTYVAARGLPLSEAVAMVPDLGASQRAAPIVPPRRTQTTRKTSK